MADLSGQSDQRAQRAADDAEIRNLVMRIAHLTDQGDPDGFAAQFAEDGVFEVVVPGNDYTAHGRDDIRKGAAKGMSMGRMGPKSAVRHLISTLWIEVNGDEARGHAYPFILTDIDTAPRIGWAIVYNDRYVRTDAGWKLAHRRITTRQT